MNGQATPIANTARIQSGTVITAGGSTVVLYRAGRTAAGAQATASHTASVAGDSGPQRELARG